MLYINGSYYLIDCGVSKTQIALALAENGLDFDDIRGIFITHSQSDHVKGLAMITKYAKIPVYLDSTTASEMLVRKNFERDGDATSFQVWREPEFCIDDEWLQVIETSHDSAHSCGFKFRFEATSLVYLTDLGHVDEALIAQAAGANYYVFESKHDPVLLAATNRPIWLQNRISAATDYLNNEQNASAIQKMITAQTKAVVLAHLSQEANTPLHAQQAFERDNSDYTGVLIIAPAQTMSEWIE